MERPILMTTESVKAILDGRKTMTRRVIKPQPKLTIADGFYKANIQKLIEGGDRVCPHGQVGDLLWVKETWWCPERGLPVAYKANLEPHQADRQIWKPSIFMFRKDSRLLLEITGLRAERLQDITEEDAIAEGIKLLKVGMPPHQVSVFAMEYPTPLVGDTAISGYRFLWNSINAKWKRLWNKELKIYEFWQFPWCAEDAKPIPKTAEYPERYHCIPNPWVFVIKFDNIGVRVK